METLNEYSKKLKRSGYPASTRADVIKAAIQTWSKNGNRPKEVAGAPLIICPQAGNSFTEKMKTIFKKFSEDTKINVKVVTRE